MKKFEEELNNGLVSIGQNIITKEYAYGKGALINYFKDWVSPEDYQNTVASNKAYEKSNLVLSKENAKFVVENIELEKQIIELKSQLEKQQPEIPEFVTELIKYAKENGKTIRWCLYGNCKELYPQAAKWIGADDDIEFTEKTREQQEIFVHAWLNGYTVAKEKRFYLREKNTSYYLNKNRYDDLELVCNPYFDERMQFTQQEIDSMETGSYEQIGVTE